MTWYYTNSCLSDAASNILTCWLSVQINPRPTETIFHNYLIMYLTFSYYALLKAFKGCVYMFIKLKLKIGKILIGLLSSLNRKTIIVSGYPEEMNSILHHVIVRCCSIFCVSMTVSKLICRNKVKNLSCTYWYIWILTDFCQFVAYCSILPNRQINNYKMNNHRKRSTYILNSLVIMIIHN